jgi:segregation and condensation protein A
MSLATLDLDLEVFNGPFDLLLTLVLREEIDLLEVDLAEVVLAYVEHLERAGELDLEAATEFLVLIAALLELYKRGEATWEQDEPFAEITVEAREENPWPGVLRPEGLDSADELAEGSLVEAAS